MAAKDDVLLSSGPVFKDVLLEMLEGCRDLGEATARMSETVLNALMSMQADEACGAPWGERSEERVNSRNGYRERGLSTTAGDLALEVPKLRKGTYFPDDILRRWGRADAALAAAITEMYVQGVPAGKVEAVAREPGLDSMPGSRVSSMCASLDAEVDEFRTRPLGWRRWCYLWLDATWARCRVEGGSVSQAAVAAIALGEDGCKRFCGADVMDTESYADWDRFLANLRDRGLDGVQLVVSDAHGGLKRAAAERFQGASRRRRCVHLMRDVAGHVRNRRDRARAVELPRAAFAQRDPLVARAALRRRRDRVVLPGRGRVPRRRAGGLPRLHGLPLLPLAQDPRRQRAGAREPRDKAARQGGAAVPVARVPGEARGGSPDRRGGRAVAAPHVQPRGDRGGVGREEAAGARRARAEDRRAAGRRRRRRGA